MSGGLFVIISLLDYIVTLDRALGTHSPIHGVYGSEAVLHGCES
jgi:hypothetical protein